jgi:hypothetical protein
MIACTVHSRLEGTGTSLIGEPSSPAEINKDYEADTAKSTAHSRLLQ